ncbi:MAG: cytochrome-c peroxidase [Acidobacteriota bacterium]
MRKRVGLLSSTIVVFAVLMLIVSNASAAGLSPKELLGKKIFFDTNLSKPVGMSCSSCHNPNVGWVDPDSNLPVSQGVVTPGKPNVFGGRNAPSSAYAAYSPAFHLDVATGLYVGGQFWDGRALTLADQAKGPFLNPVEMKATKSYVVNQVRLSAYSQLFKDVYGPNSLNVVNSAYNLIADAIAAYETSHQVNKFSSKYDKFLKGTVQLTALEQRGLSRFGGKAKCSNCHILKSPAPGVNTVFTDFTYDNLGVPSNPEVLTLIGNPAFVDLGLGASAALAAPDPLQDGKFKVPTLRNVAKTFPYAHNGYFTKLQDIVHFYNTRDTLPVCTGAAGDVPGTTCWPAPEVAANVNVTEVGNLGLTAADELAIVAFLNTLSDQ